MSTSPIESAISECAQWNIMDANVYVGSSGVHADLALEAPELLREMDRFGIGSALVTHFAGHEYDAVEGNRALAHALHARFEPAWSVTTDCASLADLENLSPRAVRLWFGTLHHNFSSARWCSGELLEYLQDRGILVAVSRPEIEWDALAVVLQNHPRLKVLLLDIGYRSDRYLFPLLKQHANLYFDSSMFVGHRQLESYVESHGAGRIAFGSRLPLYTPGAALAVLASARISNHAKLAVAGDNLRRLLQEPL